MVYCWWCCSYHDRVHFCETLNKWRQIDITNLIIINGPTRESVERYKNEFPIEHNVECKLYNSRSLMNQQEKGAVEQVNEERWRRARQERDALDAKEYWEKNSKIYEGMECRESFEYLSRQGLSIGALEQVKFKLACLNSSLGKTGNIY